MTLRGIGDDLGPTKILLVREPGIGLEAMVVVDNVACGPAIGGTRMAPDVTLAEVERLARAMTFKNAAAGLPHGGAKSGIVADPADSTERKETLIRAFARAIHHLVEYIPGPDMGTDEACMAWMDDEGCRTAGKPAVIGGIPLDEIGATGLGLAVAAEVAAPVAGIDLDGALVAIQGFGAVGRHVARFLVERGCRIVAVSDSRGATVNGGGFDVAALTAHKTEDRLPVAEFPGGRALDRDEVIGVDCDIWIPAARPDVLRIDNVERLRARLVLQGANIPATSDAEEWMHASGILSVPDFIANAGGVICASVEYHGGTESQALATIAEKVRANTAETLERAKRESITPRQAAVAMARARVERAMTYRRP